MTIMTTMAIPQAVQPAMLHSALVTALDTRSYSYWAEIDWSACVRVTVDLAALEWLDAHDRVFWRDLPHCSFWPLLGGSLVFVEADTGARLTLDAASLLAGAAILAARYPHHYADLVGGEDDAVTADVLLQCATLGDIVYG